MRLGALVPGLALIGIAQAAIWIAGLEGAGTTGYAWRAALLFVLQVAAAALVWHRNERAIVWIVVGFGLLFRVAALHWPPDLSSDLHRYVWDGRVQSAGVSPYRYPPSAPELAHLREETWPRINRPDAVTIYPPGAQAGFLALAAAGLGSVRGIRAAALLSDLAVLAMLLYVLARRRLPAGRIVLYAWSPLVIAEVCVSGHVEVLAVLLSVAGLLCADAERPGLAGALVGAAALVKLHPIVLLAAIGRGRRSAVLRRLVETILPSSPPMHPARLRCSSVTYRTVCALLRLPQSTRRGAPRRPGASTPIPGNLISTSLLTALCVLALGYLPYVAVARFGVLGFLPEYLRSGEDFNAGLRSLVEWACAPVGPQSRVLASLLCVALYAAVLARIAARGRDAFRSGRTLALAYVMLSPTAMHPWYALLLAALLVIDPCLPGLWLLGTLPLSYLKYGAPGETMPVWVMAIEWVPAFGLVLAQWATERPYRWLSWLAVSRRGR